MVVSITGLAKSKMMTAAPTTTDTAATCMQHTEQQNAMMITTARSHVWEGCRCLGSVNTVMYETLQATLYLHRKRVAVHTLTSTPTISLSNRLLP